MGREAWKGRSGELEAQDSVARERRDPCVIAAEAPGSLDELARMRGKAKSNLSRTLRTMEAYGLVALDRGAGGRIRPRITHDRVALELPLALAGQAGWAAAVPR
jgi:predicted transcriptional regulator